MIIPMKLRARPVLDISRTFNLFVPKMMAFGAVAEGSINASEAEMVAGNINSNGLISILMARPAKTGRKVSTVATFEVSSVRNVINKDTDKMITNGCTSLSQINWSPNH